jgi:hypothetical protein
LLLKSASKLEVEIEEESYKAKRKSGRAWHSGAAPGSIPSTTKKAVIFISS